MAVNKVNFEKAMAAALGGREVKELKIDKHEFNIKPVKISREGDKIKVSGQNGHQISHHLSFRDDDQVFYSFDKVGDSIENLEINIEEGVKLGEIIRVVLDIIQILKDAEKSDSAKSDSARSTRTSLFGATAKKAVNNEIFEKTKVMLDGTWENEAKFLITNIALRVN